MYDEGTLKEIKLASCQLSKWSRQVFRVWPAPALELDDDLP